MESSVGGGSGGRENSTTTIGGGGTGMTTAMTFSSPLFENFLNYVPKDHESALRAAFYNVCALAVFCGIIFGSYYVFVILQPFLLPMFWALLTGFVLHPHKSKLTASTKSVLDACLESDSSALYLSLVSVLRLLDTGAEAVGTYIFIQNLKNILILALIVPLTYLIYFYSTSFVFNSVFDALGVVWSLPLWSVVDFISWYHLVTLFIVYALSLVFIWRPDLKMFFRICSILLWTLFAFFLLNQLWSPVFYCFLIVVSFGLILNYFRTMIYDLLIRDQTDLEGEEDVGDGIESSTPAVELTAATSLSKTVLHHQGVSALRQSHFTPIRSLRSNRRVTRRQQQRRRRSLTFSNEPSESSTYIGWVFWACGCIQIWLHPQLLHLLPVPMVYFLIKRIYFLEVMTPLRGKVNEIGEFSYRWCMDRIEAISPPFSPVYRTAEKNFLQLLPRNADVIVTGVLLFSLIGLFFVISVFVSFQLYYETVYIMQTSGHLVSKLSNSTVFRHLNESISIDYGMEGIVESGYHQGRSYISSTLKQVLGDEEFESRVLELWDRTYQYWLSDRNSSNPAGEEETIYGPVVTGEALSSSMEEIFERVKKTNVFSISSLTQFAKDNMGTLTSILEHSWTLIVGNVGFMASLVFELIRVLLQSGSGFINFIFSIIIYFTALFYLLIYSGSVYRPVELASNLLGQVLGDGFAANAINKAVNSVFILTVRMATFYGLWTYLTHTIFEASIVMVPVLVATFLAAVPVAGQYLVAVPAALELWLAEGRWISAILLVLCHIAPMWVVDAAIYAEVKRGIHPWITGLSIVGGIYCFGVLGAIYGPLTVCAVYVVLTMYTDLLIPDPEPIPATETVKSRLVTPYFKRSESIM